MKAPLSWLTQFASLPDMSPAELAEAFTQAGLQVETITDPAAAIDGPVVVGRVLSIADEPQKNGKVIRWCQVDVGPHNPDGADSRGIVCGAHNFVVGDYVPVVLAGTTLPGGFTIAARKTYGHVSDGMICAEDELGLGDDHTGIIVFPRHPAPVIGSDALELLGAREVVFDIDVTPDEGYCLSIRGLAREAAQITGGVFTDPYGLAVPPTQTRGHEIILDSPNCPLFVALSITGVDPGAPTPDWMVKRLRAVGVRSVSLAVDITNYVMIESGQPLHAYDAGSLRGPIRVRQAVAGEKLTTLDHVVRTLSSDDLLITDDSGPIGLAGVMGGVDTELTDTTTDILLEAAWFEPTSVGRTYRRHHLPSEASKRFERGVDRAGSYAAARRAAELLAELAGGTIEDGFTIAGSPRAMPSVTMTDTGLASRILGVEVGPERVVEILRASGVTVVDEPGGGWTFTPPSWRGDLVDAYDYIEEVGRKTGFQAIPSRVPSAPGGRGYTREQRLRRGVLETVAASGFTEVVTLPFIGQADLDRLSLDTGDPRRQLVRVANPLSGDQPYLRTTLLPGLLAAVGRNRSRSLEDLALFECGLVFRGVDTGAAIMPDVSVRPDDEQIATLFANLPAQPRHLAGVAVGDWLPAGANSPAHPVTWAHAVGLAETAANALGIDLVRRAAQMAPWHPGRCAELGVMWGDEFVSVGWAGQLHPGIVRDLDLPETVVAVELDLDALIAAAPGVGQIRPLSAHPATKQDVAVVVQEEVPASAVEAALHAGAGDQLESIRLFDVFRGDQVGAGRKSLAYSLVFRAADRTLTEADASQAREAAVAEAARRVGAVLRGT